LKRREYKELYQICCTGFGNKHDERRDVSAMPTNDEVLAFQKELERINQNI
jgi:hypothetical protein